MLSVNVSTEDLVFSAAFVFVHYIFENTNVKIYSSRCVSNDKLINVTFNRYFFGM